MDTSRAASALACENISAMPKTNARDVSFTSVMISLPMAGRMRLITCGSTIFMNVCARGYPSTFAASYWPLQHERRAAQDGDVELRQRRHDPKTAHAAERDDDAQRQGADERHEENLGGEQQPITQKS